MVGGERGGVGQGQLQGRGLARHLVVELALITISWSAERVATRRATYFALIGIAVTAMPGSTKPRSPAMAGLARAGHARRFCATVHVLFARGCLIGPAAIVR